MKLVYALLAIILLGTLILTGCQATVTPVVSTTPSSQATTSSTVDSSVPSGAAAGDTGFTVTDDLGRIVRIKGVPQRIISLAPSNTEMVYALGLEDRLIGVTTYDNYPPAAKDKPQVSEYSNVDIEKIVSLQPDLVLADSIHKPEVIPALEKLGITVVAIIPGSINQVLNELILLGTISGKNAQAASLVESLQKRVQAVTDTVARANEAKPRVLYVTWHDPIWTAGDDTMVGDLFSKVGVTNIANDLSGYATISLETVIERNPQIIVVMSTMGVQNESLEYILKEPRFQATEALKNQRVYELDTDIFGRTTPRIIDGLEQLAKIVHPDLFK
jgi:iron complex transport system substrate-binding protein